MKTKAGPLLLFSLIVCVLTLVLTRLFLGEWHGFFSFIITASVLLLIWVRDAWMFKHRPAVESTDFSHHFCKLLTQDSESQNFLPKLLALLEKHIGVRISSFYLRGTKEDYVLSPAISEHPSPHGDRILETDPFINFLKHEKGPLLKRSIHAENSERKQKVMMDRMVQHKADLLVPLHVGEDLVAFIFIGSKENGRPYLRDELKHYTQIFSQIALVIQNCSLRENLSCYQARMRRTDRLALLGTLTAGLAHEIRNPLVSIKTYFQLLPEKYDDREFRDRFQKVAASEVDRISRLVEELLTFARPAEPTFRPVNMHNLIDEILTLLESTAQSEGVKLERHYDQENSYDVLCDPEQIKQVLLNIAHNAFDAMDGNGAVTFCTRYDQGKGKSGFVHIEVEDNGVGMCPEEIEKLFVPFYTTKSSGTGLGLAISRQIVEEHLGSISVDSEAAKGTTFYLHLPKSPPMHDRRKDRDDSESINMHEMVQ